MRKLLFLCIMVTTVTLYAQQKEDTISSTKRDSLVTNSEKIISYPLQVTYDKTTHLIFPSAIRYVDLGNENIIADKAKEAENVLRVKASQEDFTATTNLSVITQQGQFFSFDVTYNVNPKQLTIDLSNKFPQTHSAESIILFSEFSSVNQIIMNAIYDQKRASIKHIGSMGAEIIWFLRSLYVHNGKLYLDIGLKNQSKFPFEVDFISFKIIDKKISKRSITQEISIQPLQIYAPLHLISPYKQSHTVFMLEQINISEDKVLQVEIFEKNIGRYQSFSIGHKELQKARLIEQLKLKL